MKQQGDGLLSIIFGSIDPPGSCIVYVSSSNFATIAIESYKKFATLKCYASIKFNTCVTLLKVII